MAFTHTEVRINLFLFYYVWLHWEFLNFILLCVALLGIYFMNTCDLTGNQTTCDFDVLYVYKTIKNYHRRFIFVQLYKKSTKNISWTVIS